MIHSKPDNRYQSILIIFDQIGTARPVVDFIMMLKTPDLVDGGLPMFFPARHDCSLSLIDLYYLFTYLITNTCNFLFDNKAFKQMELLISEFLRDTFASQYFPKIIDCVIALREQAVSTKSSDRAKAFNQFLYSVRDQCTRFSQSDFWKLCRQSVLLASFFIVLVY